MSASRLRAVLALVPLLAMPACSDSGASGGSSVLAQPASSKESFGEVAPFALTERSGRAVTRDTLLGKPWVAGFIFTRCTGPCPIVSGNMKRLQEKLAGVDARLVTISVDPEHDTPAVLTEYARTLGADPERWLFLTGRDADVQTLIVKSFLLPVERDEQAPVGQRVTHRTVLATVDARGRLRGYYEGETADGVEQAAARIRFLASER